MSESGESSPGNLKPVVRPRDEDCVPPFVYALFADIYARLDEALLEDDPGLPPDLDPDQLLRTAGDSLRRLESLSRNCDLYPDRVRNFAASGKAYLSVALLEGDGQDASSERPAHRIYREYLEKAVEKFRAAFALESTLSHFYFTLITEILETAQLVFPPDALSRRHAELLAFLDEGKKNVDVPDTLYVVLFHILDDLLGPISHLPDIPPPPAHHLASRARAYMALGKSFQALECLTRAHKADPQSHAYWHDYAQLLLNCEEYDKAEEVLLSVIERSPENVSAHLMMAELLLKRSNDDDHISGAERCCQVVLRLRPQNLKAQEMLGYIQHHRQNYPEAVRIFSSLWDRIEVSADPQILLKQFDPALWAQAGLKADDRIFAFRVACSAATVIADRDLLRKCFRGHLSGLINSGDAAAAREAATHVPTEFRNEPFFLAFNTYFLILDSAWPTAQNHFDTRKTTLDPDNSRLYRDSLLALVASNPGEILTQPQHTHAQEWLLERDQQYWGRLARYLTRQNAPPEKVYSCVCEAFEARPFSFHLDHLYEVAQWFIIRHADSGGMQRAMIIVQNVLEHFPVLNTRWPILLSKLHEKNDDHFSAMIVINNFSAKPGLSDADKSALLVARAELERSGRNVDFDPASALQDLRDALDLTPKNVKVLSHLAAMLIRYYGQHDEALSLSCRALQTLTEGVLPPSAAEITFGRELVTMVQASLSALGRLHELSSRRSPIFRLIAPFRKPSSGDDVSFSV